MHPLLPPLDPDDSIGDPMGAEVLQPALLVDLQLIPRTLDFNQFVTFRCSTAGSREYNQVGKSGFVRTQVLAEFVEYFD